MSLALEKIAKEFATLTPQEKIEFLKRVTISNHGEWVELNGKIIFIPYDDEPWTEEDEAYWQEGQTDIAEGRVKPWDQVKKELGL